MVAVRNYNGAGASAAGNVDKSARLILLCNKSFYRRGFGADNSDNPMCRNHISEADIDKFHHKIICAVLSESFNILYLFADFFKLCLDFDNELCNFRIVCL